MEPEKMEQIDNKLIFMILTTDNYSEWSELIRLVLMNKGLWPIVNGDETLEDYSTGSDKAKFRNRNLQAYSLISLNCSSNMRRTLNTLDHEDGCLAWRALKAKAFSRQPTIKLNKLTKFLEMKMEMGDKATDFNVRFNRVIDELSALEIDLDPTLVLAIYLKALDKKFAMLCTTIRYDSATVDAAMLHVESEEESLGSTWVDPQRALAVTTPGHCSHCGDPGHAIDECWGLHPHLRPKCDSCNGRHYTNTCRRSKSKAKAYFAIEEDPYML